jgi:hypothetical protein
MDNNRKMEASIMGRDGSRDSCGEKAPAGSTVFNWGRSFNSGKETAPAAVRDWCRNTAKEWFREAIRKLLRRWHRCIIWEGICWASSCLIFSLKIKKNWCNYGESKSFLSASLNTVVAEKEFRYCIWKWFSQPICLRSCIIIITIIIITIIAIIFIVVIVVK